MAQKRHERPKNADRLMGKESRLVKKVI